MEEIIYKTHLRKLSTEETIKAYTNENGFSWGINTVIDSLAPGSLYDLNVGREITIENWKSTYPQPTSRQIRDEYIRQKTIAECIDYFKKNKIKNILFL
jgi:hypothetical protein